MELNILLGFDKVKHIGYNGHQHRLTLRTIITRDAWLGIECYRSRVVVITTTLVGNAYATLWLAVVAMGGVMHIAVLADMNVIKGGMHIGLMMIALAGKRNDTARCKYRDIQQKHRKCRK